ncbi:hypothetical protein ACFPOH_06475 [Ureibacillus suwonensis]|uniref:Uncharacterized protein n=1 Tax=Ureibacillus suwonensis TaxID=313007 RepID=A0ABW0R9I4_9BACL
MPIIYVGPGVVVYVIIEDQIYKGTIVKLFKNKKIRVEYTNNKNTTIVGNFEYGKNVFMTWLKAWKIKNERFPSEIAESRPVFSGKGNNVKEKGDTNIDKNEENSITTKYKTIPICNSCGVALNEFGHCRCTL